MHRAKTMSGEGAGNLLTDDLLEKGRESLDVRLSNESTGTGYDTVEAPTVSAGPCCSTKTKFAVAGVLTLAAVAAILLYVTHTVTMKDFNQF